MWIVWHLLELSADCPSAGMRWRNRYQETLTPAGGNVLGHGDTPVVIFGAQL